MTGYVFPAVSTEPPAPAGTVVHKTWQELVAEQPNRKSRRALARRYGQVRGALGPGGRLAPRDR